ncbi:MAG: class II glutamine amidotransferase [Sulfuricella sp.]|nr:class II glutamine amidotransferase [Sulfuricella sp.]
MCELFGMSASRPVVASETLANFRLRGGLAADNPDGWGLAWWEGDAFRLAKEPSPAYRSPLFADLCKNTRSNLIIAHVRKANFPPVNTLNNTHPFLRTCCGKAWVFAHNGLVPDIVEVEQANGKAVCRPSGETDSEYAFCHLLSHLAENFDSNGAGTDAADSFARLAMVSELIATHGQFNFLMSDGEYLIAYGHDRLHYLEPGGEAGDAVLIATEPLSASGHWIPFEPGELRIYRLGRLVGRIRTRQREQVPA